MEGALDMTACCTTLGDVVRLVLVMVVIATTAHADPAPPRDQPGELVDLTTVIPDVVLDLRYATANNLTKEVLYPVARCRMRRAVAERLARVAEQLRKRDRRLLIWDCYRPTSVQEALWKRMPDPRYVANPRTGSRHSRGAAIDLGLADKDGAPVVLPTAFDDLSRAAHRTRALASEQGAEARHLDAAMTAAGFLGLSTEWWHFDAPDSAKYALSNEPL